MDAPPRPESPAPAASASSPPPSPDSLPFATPFPSTSSTPIPFPCASVASSSSSSFSQPEPTAPPPTLHYVYVLALEHGHFYVGRSRTRATLRQRWQQHWAGTATWYTRRYRPLAVAETLASTDPGAEEAATLRYMAQHGADRVRGAHLCRATLATHERRWLETRLRAARNACYRCGGLDHFATACGDAAAEASDSESDDPCSTDAGAEETIEVPTPCARCGRYGHAKRGCVFKRDRTGKWIL